jgi:hypothetical protein
MVSFSGAGLCGGCRHARLNQTRRGPVYLRCLLAGTDEAYPRYPRLPVLRCAGYQPATESGAESGAEQPRPAPDRPEQSG